MLKLRTLGRLMFRCKILVCEIKTLEIKCFYWNMKKVFIYVTLLQKLNFFSIRKSCSYHDITKQD